MTGEPIARIASMGPRPPGRWGWPTDVAVLGAVAAQMWAITALWIGFGLGELAQRSMQSETGIWLLAISGLLFAILAVAPIVAIWGYLLGAVTCLLVANAGLCRMRPVARWPIAVGATTLLLVSVATVAGRHARAEPRPQGPAAARPHDDLAPTASDLEELDQVLAAIEKQRDARCAALTDATIAAACARYDAARRWQDDARP